VSGGAGAVVLAMVLAALVYLLAQPARAGSWSLGASLAGLRPVRPAAKRP
jgi:hypothetical protein